MGILEAIEEDGSHPRMRRRPRFCVSDTALDYSCAGNNGLNGCHEDRPTRNKIRRLHGPKYIPLADYLSKNEVTSEQDESASMDDKHPSDFSLIRMGFEQQYSKIPEYLRQLGYEDVKDIYKPNFKKDRRVWLHKSSSKKQLNTMSMPNDHMQNEPQVQDIGVQLAKKDSRKWLHKSSDNKKGAIDEPNDFRSHYTFRNHSSPPNRTARNVGNSSPSKSVTLISSSASLYLNSSFENLYVDTDEDVTASKSNDSVRCLPDLDNDWCIV
ncbi:unnamed protein product [Owenia fusiformis]|uniref:Uncharacterized protein n=1 Tax=Owenia fusiformis TaxID=6347 RepID=A0A8S4N306_OWEFU|nr:unnamed protein product [Owenia fusiformis]